MKTLTHPLLFSTEHTPPPKTNEEVVIALAQELEPGKSYVLYVDTNACDWMQVRKKLKAPKGTHVQVICVQPGKDIYTGAEKSLLDVIWFHEQVDVDQMKCPSCGETITRDGHDKVFACRCGWKSA